MAGFTNAFSKTVLDSQIANGDHVLWSENGTSESSNLAGTTITTFAAATTADPSVKSNSGAYETAAATGACTISHWSLWDSTETTQKTDWIALSGGSETLAVDDKLSIADGELDITLT